MKYRLEDLLTDALQHPVLKSLPATTELSKKYNIAVSALTSFEEDIVNTWVNHNVKNFCIKKIFFKGVIAFLQYLGVDRRKLFATNFTKNGSRNG